MAKNRFPYSVGDTVVCYQGKTTYYSQEHKCFIGSINHNDFIGIIIYRDNVYSSGIFRVLSTRKCEFKSQIFSFSNISIRPMRVVLTEKKISGFFRVL